jgi:L-amino acid N-acyltransferase YncA
MSAPITIRDARAGDLPIISGFFREIVDAGETYAYPPALDDEGIARLWMPGPPFRCAVAVDADGAILGSATMGPNRPGRGSHIATASFMVAPQAQGRGVGRALGSEALSWARERGYHGMQFNAVVETNDAAVHLWRDLGFEIMTTIPEAFEHPRLGRVGLHIMYRRLGPGD